MGHRKKAGTLKVLHKVTISHMYKVYMKHKQILCLELGPIPKLPHCAYANIPKSE
jgi:hypothetical protein